MRIKKGAVFLLVSLVILVGIFSFGSMFVSADDGGNGDPPPECIVDSDCTKGIGLYCDGNSVYDKTGVCDWGVCEYPQKLIKNCVDDLFCNGEETCSAGSCVPGDAIVCNIPPTEPDVQCYDAQGSCNEGTNQCDYTFVDTTGPVTSDLTVTKVINVCAFDIKAKATDECSVVNEAEYFLASSCGDEGTGTLLDATDGFYDSLIEDVLKNNVAGQDGEIPVSVRAKDVLGNWGACELVQISLDCIPPKYPTCEIGNTNPNAEFPNGVVLNDMCNPQEKLVCGINPIIEANLCDTQSDIQLAEYFLDDDPLINFGGISMDASDGAYDEQCEDVKATIDLDKLGEGTHYAQLHGKDTQETWGKFINNPIISFIKDTTPPKTEKTIDFAGDVFVNCTGKITQANGHTLTNGCAYVKSGTKITLSANDFNPDNGENGGFNDLEGEYAGDVIINWNVWFSNDCTVQNPIWESEPRSSGVGGFGEDVVITLEEDSCHLIEYWASDGCSLSEEKHYELDIVDSKAPESVKSLGDPNVKCSQDIKDLVGNEDCNYVTKDTTITLSCTDPEPHPVDDVEIKFRTRLKTTFGDAFPEWKKFEPYVGPFSYGEDSVHELEWFCEDALGNEEVHHFEIDIVDTVKPEIEKTVVGPQFGECPPEPYHGESEKDKHDYFEYYDQCYIDGVTVIEVDATDPEPHPVNEVECEYYYFVYEDEEDYYYDNGKRFPVQGTFNTFPINFPEESIHELFLTCTDALGNDNEDVEVFIVDKTPPVTEKTYEGPIFDDMERSGDASANWVQSEKDSGLYSAKLVIPNNPDVGDFAGVDSFFDVFVELDDVTDLSYERKVTEIGNQAWIPLVVLGIDTDGDGEFEAHPLEWEVSLAGTPNPALLGDDSFIQCEHPTGQLFSPDTDWTSVDAYNNFKCYTPNEAGDGYEAVYQPLSHFQSNDVGRIEPTDKIAMVKVMLNVPAADGEVVYVDSVEFNGNIIIDEPSTRWITTDTEVHLSAFDPEPHPSEVDMTFWRNTIVPDENCRSVDVCQLAEGEGPWNKYDGSFTMSESCNLIEYYSVDNVDKTEIVKKQCVFVDDTPPTTDKEVGEPQFPCDGDEEECGPEGTPQDKWDNLYVNSTTPITLSCEDQGPHPVDNSELCFAVSWHVDKETCEKEDGGEWIDLETKEESFCYITQKYAGDSPLTDGFYCIDLEDEEFEFNFLEDSLHNLEWFCEDALGNEGELNVEWDNVDNQPPEIVVWNPTTEEGNNVTRCTQAIVIEAFDEKSGLDESTIYAELINDSGAGEVLETVELTKSVYGTYESLMNKQHPAGDYILRICASDNLGNENCVDIVETLTETLIVEFIHPAECNVNPENGGECEFTFNICLRGSNEVQFWMNKIDGVVTPDMMDAMTHSDFPDDAFVGLRHNDKISDAGNLTLDCFEVNGKDEFNLTLDISAEIANEIGPGIHDFEYWISHHLDECVV